MSDPDDVLIRRDDDAAAYLLEHSGRRVGGLFYRAAGDVLTLVHTEVDDAYAGRHLGGRLVQAALDDIRTRGERIIPRCPFVVAFLDAHEQYRDLVADD